jgi:tetratricopeptide (TPR) repeat protein
MLSGQCYRGLDQIRNAALRETVAFAHWRRSYRNSQDIVAFRELDKLDLLTGFFLVTVYLPDNQTVSNESYRALLAQSVREQSPLDGARHLRIYVVDAFGNEDFSKIARPLYWAELAREIQLDQAAADIALGNTDVAVESMIAVNEFRPGDPGLGEKMVAALDQAGARQSADHLFESISRFYFRTLKKYPRSPLHHNNYAWICARAGRQLTPALRHGMVAIAERPLTTNYLDTLAEVYFHLGEPDSAAELSQRCTQIAPRKRHYQNQFRRFSRQH